MHELKRYSFLIILSTFTPPGRQFGHGPQQVDGGVILVNNFHRCLAHLTTSEWSPYQFKNTAIIQQNISMSPFLQMGRVQNFTDSLYDSSSDSAEETPKPKRDSQKLRRRSCRPVSLFFLGGGGFFCVFMIVKMSVSLASESDGDSSNL